MVAEDEKEARLLTVLGGLAAELHPGRIAPESVALDSRLDRDLGLDSLARVELLVRLEKTFDASVSETDLMEAETPRDLLRALKSGGGPGPSREKVRIGPAGILSETPERAETLNEVLDWHAGVHPDQPHVRLYSDDGEGEIITYGVLKARAGEIAAGLMALGLDHGRAVALMLPTGKEYFFTFFGVLLAGGVPVPIYPPTQPARLEEHLLRHAGILNNSRAGILVTVDEAKRFSALLKARVETLSVVTTVSDFRAEAGSFPSPAVKSGDTAFIQYTSGSTGDPKGVVLSHANLLANLRAMRKALKITADDVFVSWLPLYHDMGLIGLWLGSLYQGVPLVLIPPLSFLARPSRWLWAIHRYGGTLSAAPNFAFELCLSKIPDRELDGLDLSTWRVALNGAEAVSPNTIDRFCEAFEPHGFRRTTMLPAYGLAECSVGLALSPPGRGPLIDRIGRKTFTRAGKAEPAGGGDGGGEGDILSFVACGPPLQGHEIRIVDGAGREVPDRREGRVLFRGPSATAGYFRKPEATRALFALGWLRSGDLGYMADGEVYITGREKDIIIRAGRNIYPEEIEGALGAIEGIQKGNVAVFASPDPKSGTERLIVLAECRRAGEKDQARLKAKVTALVTDLAGVPPDDVALAPPRTVPKTSSGKIRRSACREIYEGGRIGKPSRALWWQVARIVLSGVKPWLRKTFRRMGEGLYAAYVWTLVGVAAPVIWCGSILVPGLALRWTVLGGVVRLLMRLCRIPFSVRGRLPENGGPVILASNHASYLDAFVLVAALPRPAAFVAKAELKSSWVTSIPLHGLGVVFVERFDPKKGVAAVKELSDRAGQAQEAPLLFFPEGTLSRRPGLLAFQTGAFSVAVAAKAAIVPMAVRGTRNVLREGSWFPRRGPVTVVIGDPVELEGEKGGEPNDWTAALQLRDGVRARILRLCGEPDLVQERIWADRAQGYR